MALEAPVLFNFYFRYTWDQNDFANWQEGMVALQQNQMQGLFGGAVMGGFDLTPVSGMLYQASSGIAVGPTGYVMVQNNPNNLRFTPPVSFPRMDLVVIRPLNYTVQTITDPDPTSPSFGTQVPLTTAQDSQLVLIQGNEANIPVYPSIQPFDVILAGFLLTPGMSNFAGQNYDLDLNIRDIYGRKSNFQQNFGRYDDRLRPYASTTNTLGIKPSQLVHPNARAFSFTNKQMPSIYPKSAGGLYNGSAGDAFYNFQTGAITGSDAASTPFTPTIPTAGNFVNASVGITTSDTIQVVYGAQGTYKQCQDGISSQVNGASAGGIGVLTNAKLVAIVTVGSNDGVNITQLQYVDCRGVAAVGQSQIAVGSAGAAVAALNYTIGLNDRGRLLEVNSNAINGGTIQLPAPNGTYLFTVLDVGGNMRQWPVNVLRAATESINGLPSNYLLEANGGRWTFFEDGTNWYVI